ncbi:cytochrome c oxidase subunit II (plasmid) [Ensifer adhaerens]|nr:cytochrome c oxidase subunit II [Ensifer adhaerens]
MSPAGMEANGTFGLLVTMTVAAGLIWLGVIAMLCFALRSRRQTIGEEAANAIVLWGGAVTPSIATLVLLAYAFWLIPSLRPFAATSEPAIRIEVTARQYWWQVVYLHPGPPIVTANEIRLPAGRQIEFVLRSDDVIHSFWIPSLAGKMDMIPGRQNRLSVIANKTGVYRGPCAEYCGTSHALMALTVIVMEQSAYDTWRTAQTKPATQPDGKAADLFVKHGCGACHRVGGTEASATLGPDLTHLGSRLTLGAGATTNTKDNIARFILAPDAVKPGANMPAFSMLPREDIRTIAAWLKGLR